jgi:hypothetical protein
MAQSNRVCAKCGLPLGRRGTHASADDCLTAMLLEESRRRAALTADVWDCFDKLEAVDGLPLPPDVGSKTS